MPQTEEHLAICQMLGITRGLVVLTKCDLVSEVELATVRERVHAALRMSFLCEAAIVPVSVRSGLGIAPLEATDPNRAKVAALAELYRRAALNPPAFADVLRELRFSEKDARRFVTSLLREKTLVKVAAADIFMHRVAIEALERTVRELKHQTLDVGRLKEMTGLSRKYAIPLLEYLDRQRVTRRQGTTRVVL